MHIVSPKKLREFWTAQPRSRPPLTEWLRLAKRSVWTSFDDVKAVFGTRVDRVGHRYVFDIGGNKYRLIAEFNFGRKKLFVRQIMTHAEYDRGAWKGG